MAERESIGPVLPPRTTSLDTTTEQSEDNLSPLTRQSSSPRYSPRLPSKSRSSSDVSGESKDVTPPLKRRNKPPMPPPKPQVHENEPIETTDGFLRSKGQPNKSKTKLPSFDSATSEVLFSPVSMKVGEILQLADFVKKYSQVLPLRVKVEEGYCGAEERFVISTGDIYNLHFVKSEKVISIQDCGGTNFCIPLNSSVEFGLLYDPVNDFKQALKGYLFRTVAELANYKVHPQVIRSSKAYDSGDAKTSVQADEIFIVQKTGKSFLRKHFIKVLNVKTGEEKTLSEDCEGHFLTGPYNVRMYLPEILQHFGDNFPLDAMLFADSHSIDDSSDDLPARLTTDKVTLSHTSIESSIIASTCWELVPGSEPSEEDRIPVAIPINLDIEIAILEEYEDESLYEHTKTLFETFDPSKIKTMEPPPRKGVPPSAAQKRLYRATRLGVQSGLEISRPSKIYDVPILPEMFEENEETTTPGLQSSLSEVLKRKPLPYLTPTNNQSPATRSFTRSFTPPSSNSTSGNTNTPGGSITSVQSSSTSSIPLVPPPVGRKSYEKHVPGNTANNVSKDGAQQKPRKPYEKTSIKSQSSTGKEDGYTDLKLPESYPSSSPTSSLTALTSSPPHTSQYSDLYSQMKALKALLDATQDNSRRQISGLRTEVARVSSALEEMKKKHQLVLEEVQQLRQQLATSHRHDNRPHPQATVPIPTRSTNRLVPLGAGSETQSAPSYDNIDSMMPRSAYRGPHGGSLVMTEAMMKENKQFLETLDHVQILNLLEAMHLRQYQDTFKEEQIDGAILLECDEGVLEQELTVKNKIHRNKLMKLINGRYSAAKILEGGDPYVSFQPSY